MACRQVLHPLDLYCHAYGLFEGFHRRKLLACPSLLVATHIIGVEHAEQFVLANEWHQEEALRVWEETKPALPRLIESIVAWGANIEVSIFQ